jgi:PAS domain-containing protein
LFATGRVQEPRGFQMLTKIEERAEEAPPGGGTPQGSSGHFRTLADYIGPAVFIIRGKRLHHVNHAAEVITGYTRKELLSMSFCDLVYPERRREPIVNRGRVHQEEIGLASRCEVRILTKNHQERDRPLMGPSPSVVRH